MGTPPPPPPLRTWTPPLSCPVVSPSVASTPLSTPSTPPPVSWTPTSSEPSRHTQFARISRFLFSWTLKCSKRCKRHKSEETARLTRQSSLEHGDPDLLGQAASAGSGRLLPPRT